MVASKWVKGVGLDRWTLGATMYDNKKCKGTELETCVTSSGNNFKCISLHSTLFSIIWHHSPSQDSTGSVKFPKSRPVTLISVHDN